MKKPIFPALVLACAAGLLPAQTSNYPFPTENAFWHTSLGCVEPYDEDVYTCGDTIMDGISYSQLYSLFSFSGSGGPPSFSGGLRRDGDRVFLKTEPGTDELLMYDFSIQADDTLRLTRRFIIWGDWTDTLEQVLFKVTKIDSLSLNGTWHKRWRLTCYNNYFDKETWIEGVGSTNGPVDRYICNFSYNVANVHCLWHNGQSVYSLFTPGTCNVQYPPECFVTVGTSRPVGGLPVASVSPNPFSDHLTVLFGENAPEDVSLKMFDLAGRELVVQYRRAGNSLRMDRSHLPPGIYFLKMVNGDPRERPVVWKVLAE